MNGLTVKPERGGGHKYYPPPIKPNHPWLKLVCLSAFISRITLVTVHNVQVAVTRALVDGISTTLTDAGKTRGLKYWMVTCFDLVNFKVPNEDDRFQYFVYQVENCPTTGRDHIQGYLELKSQTRFNQVKQMFAPAVIHLEGRKAKSSIPAINYCKKEETRVDGPWEFGTPAVDEGERGKPKIDWMQVRTKIWACKTWLSVLSSEDEEVVRACAAKLNYVKELYQAKPQPIPPPEIRLRKWQTRVIEMLNAPVEKRRIIWIWSEKSGTGKTTFFDYCSSKYDVLPGADWANTLFVYDGNSVLWFDRSRSQSDDVRGVDQFYSDLERFSNDTVHTSTKYVPTRKRVSSHIVVTANCPPDERRLPQRFVVVEAKTLEEEQEEDERNIAEMEAHIAAQHLLDIENGNATPLGEFYDDPEPAYDAEVILQNSEEDRMELDLCHSDSDSEIPLTKKGKPQFVISDTHSAFGKFAETPPDSPELSWAREKTPATQVLDDMDVDDLPDDFGDDDESENSQETPKSPVY